MDGKITYHQQVSYCGKPRCRRCREGIGHGPYWYAYQTINGRTVRTYVGKQPPAEAQGIGVGEDTREAGAADLTDVTVRLYVLGQFTLERRDRLGGQRWQTVADASMQHSRVRSLLTCLISAPGRKLGREQAVELLWPELDFETATHRLDKAVHSLRQLFEPARSRPATSNLLLTEHATLMLADQSQLRLDAYAFDAPLYQATQRGAQLALAGASPISIAQDKPQQEPEARPYMQVGRSNQSQLVGRDQELATLQQLLHTTEQAKRMKLTGQKKASALAPIAPLEARQQHQCVLLLGDVGIGKTRLAEEMGREARRRGWTVTRTRAHAQETSIPYRMWTETLRKAMTQGLWQRQELARRPLIYQALRALLPELEDLLPQMELSAASPEQEQLRLWEAARSLLITISESAPLLIVLDDLQWADSSSCELLAYLVRQMRGHPILIAVTCRDIELPPTHPLRTVLNDLQRESAIETISVQPLTDEQIRMLVSGLPEPVVQHIQAHAAGNPFFAEELARNVEAAGTAQFIAPTPTSNHATKHNNLALDRPSALPD